jgi:hypothetical protein
MAQPRLPDLLSSGIEGFQLPGVAANLLPTRIEEYLLSQ